MSGRRGRRLSGEEIWLWGEVARFVTPLAGRSVPVETEPDRRPAKAPPAPPITVPAAKEPKAPAKQAGKPVEKRISKPAPVRSFAAAPYQAPVPSSAPKPLDGLERRARTGLVRGRLPIEARIDLHGMVQAEAHAALVSFLHRCRAAGHSHVLVVTGKGGEDRGAFAERGVLRRSVPHWLRSPVLEPMVLAFEPAGRRHGGEGALYIRLRRR